MIGSFGELFINLGLVEMGSWGAADAGGDGGGEGSGDDGEAGGGLGGGDERETGGRGALFNFGHIEGVMCMGAFKGFPPLFLLSCSTRRLTSS